MMEKKLKFVVCLIIPNLFDSGLQEKLRNLFILYYSMMETGFIFIWSFSFLETFSSLVKSILTVSLFLFSEPVESVHKSLVVGID